MTRFAMLAGVGAVVVVAQSFPALGDDPPNFDIRKTCNTDVSAYQGTSGGQATDTGCLSDEQGAQTTLVSQWMQFSSASKRECIQLQGDDDGPHSYVELLTCLQMADKKFK